MVEKFSDYESKSYLQQEGKFTFTVDNAELTVSRAGNEMVVFDVSCDEGNMKLYMSLDVKARWKYNHFIAACLKLTKEARRNFELDYETIHNQLIGKKFEGIVESRQYDKEEKVNVDGLFETRVVTKTTYGINEFYPVQ